MMSELEGSKPRPLRIGVITAIPTPYRDPFLNVVAASEGVELEVIFCASQKGDRPWTRTWEQNYVTHYPKCYNLASRFGVAASVYWNPGIRRIVKDGNYDGLIVGGYNHLTMLWAIWYARRNGIPYFLASESYLAQRRSSWRVWFKQALVRSVVSHARLGLPTGDLASEYLIHYGAKAENLCQVPNIPDVETLGRQATELAQSREQIREELGIRQRRAILFVGRFITMKGGHHLLEAFAELGDSVDTELIFLGDGPKRAEWEAIARKRLAPERYQFLGFQNPEALPRWFAAADMMVLPSTNETWSVVVIEALASGLPVVVTDRVGCYANAVRPDTVGEVVRAGDEGALRDGIQKMLRDLPTHADVTAAWSENRPNFEYRVVADRLIAAIQKACSPSQQGS